MCEKNVYVPFSWQTTSSILLWLELNIQHLHLVITSKTWENMILKLRDITILHNQTKLR